jgi:hypothetical protein
MASIEVEVEWLMPFRPDFAREAGKIGMTIPFRE